MVRIPRSIVLAVGCTALAPMAFALVPPTRPPSVVAATTLGPPTLCFPIEIGDAPSLPWGARRGAFTTDPSFPLERVVPETLRLLDGSDDTLVHMETIRRAVVYLTRVHSGDVEARSRDRDAQARALTDALRAALRSRVASSDGATDRVRGLRLFDQGYATRALQESGFDPDDVIPTVDTLATLGQALRLCEDDAGMHLGMALANFHGGERGAAWHHLDATIRLSGANGDDRYAKNLVGTVGRMFGIDNHDDLVDRVRAEVRVL